MADLSLLDEMVIYSPMEGFHKVELGAYPDGMPMCAQPGPWCWGLSLTVLLRPKSFASFVASMFWVDALNERHPNASVRLVLPFIPGARQDRMNSEGDFLFTAKSVARMINSRGFDLVVVLDPHSDVAPALIDRCKAVRSHQIENVWGELESRKYTAVVSPDAGGEKRAAAFAKRLHVPLIHAWKTRSVADGKISGFGHESLPSKGKLLIVDDICDGGGTFVGLVKTFDNQKLSDLFITHGLFTRGTAAVIPSFEHIFCTDSIPRCHDGIIRLGACEQLVKENS